MATHLEWIEDANDRGRAYVGEGVPSRPLSYRYDDAFDGVHLQVTLDLRGLLDHEEAKELSQRIQNVVDEVFERGSARSRAAYQALSGSGVAAEQADER